MTESLRCQVTSAELAQIDALLTRTGQTRSEWLQGLVQAALSETPINIRNLSERVASLEKATTNLSALQQQVEELTRQIADPAFQQPSSPLSLNSAPSLAQSTQSTSEPSLSSDASQAERPSSTPVPSPSATPSIYDVEEDESCNTIRIFYVKLINTFIIKKRQYPIWTLSMNNNIPIPGTNEYRFRCSRE